MAKVSYNTLYMQHSEILSYDEYARIEKEGFPSPYVVEAGHDEQQLVFYGSSHTNDPNDPQFTDLEERWKAFISKSTKPV
ncbi:MAG TPA: hypothetical protein VIJ25_01565, partial [Methylococcales bacterium]